ncbi:E3 ubiquitin-protein ligase ZNRF2-like isoform X1 [Ptychodera flava]|uniref:E3 ubiquitin-protein ligase ZNRF2-like isoform X1 n=1 Tax=Ptychodera flava TaxID=63121 RepID=UPI003969C9D3
MGAKASTTNNPRMRTYSGAGTGGNGVSGSSAATASGGFGLAFGHGQPGTNHHALFASNSSNARGRARSLGSVQNGLQSMNIAGNGGLSPDSESSSPDQDSLSPHVFALQAQSLPAHLLSPSFLTGIKCPVCSKYVPPDDIECHLVVCLTKPRISYNQDVLTCDSGECVICFEELQQGDTIARLPCLCIYHKSCIDSWFEVNRSCPEHPND